MLFLKVLREFCVSTYRTISEKMRDICESDEVHMLLVVVMSLYVGVMVIGFGIYWIGLITDDSDNEGFITFVCYNMGLILGILGGLLGAWLMLRWKQCKHVVLCRVYQVPLYCQNPKNHRLYHATGQKCPCYGKY